MLVSAVTGEGLDELIERIEEEFARALRDVELLIPYDEGGRLAELHELAGDLEREDTPDGVRVIARLPGGGRRALRAVRAQRPSAVTRRRCASCASTRARRFRPAPTPATRASTSTRSRTAARAGRAGVDPHRNRGRDPAGPGRAGAAALGPRRPPRDRARQRPRSDRLRLSRRDPGAAAQHRPRAAVRRSPPATGSPSSCWSRDHDAAGRRGRRARRSRARRPAASARAAATSRWRARCDGGIRPVRLAGTAWRPSAGSRRERRRPRSARASPAASAAR